MTTSSVAKRVGDLMTHDPVVVDPDDDVNEAEHLLSMYRIGGLPVVSGGELVGVISQSDIVDAHGSEFISANWDRLRVRHLMSSPAITVGADADVAHAARIMLARHIHRLVVVARDGSPIGVVTPLDLLRILLDGGEEGAPLA
ncbi:MAG: CBS domain-containing protein [Chloroflexi bacterium]|nr:CBS domain-containing protein [Chloroflexota bacterium]